VERARTRLADRVHREAAGPVEIDGLGAALNRRDLGDVVGCRLGRQRAEERQRDIHAVELVDVVLAAAPRARARTASCEYWTPGMSLMRSRYSWPTGRLWMVSDETPLLMAVESFSDRGHDGGGHRHGFRDALTLQLDVNRGVRGQLDVDLTGHRRHA